MDGSVVLGSADHSALRPIEIEIVHKIRKESLAIGSRDVIHAEHIPVLLFDLHVVGSAVFGLQGDFFPGIIDHNLS